MAEFKEKGKWTYTFVLLLLTFAWAGFLAWFVWVVAKDPEQVDVLAASGVGVFLGALLIWNANVNKHWFGGEKKPPEEKPSE